MNILNTLLTSTLILGSLTTLAMAQGPKGHGPQECQAHQQQMKNTLSTFPKESLNAQEKASLQLMGEEEFLAYDVYLKLGQKWRDHRFSNITRSEKMHIEAIKTLLEKYQIPSSLSNHQTGKFQSPELQKLYDQFIKKGEKSLLDAFQVGATIEELDIVDLRKALETSRSKDIRFVYTQLMRGSRNHLRAFMRGIKREQGTYQAKYLSQAEFDAIAAGAMERGPHSR